MSEKIFEHVIGNVFKPIQEIGPTSGDIGEHPFEDNDKGILIDPTDRHDTLFCKQGKGFTAHTHFQATVITLADARKISLSVPDKILWFGSATPGKVGTYIMHKGDIINKLETNPRKPSTN